MGMDNYSLSDIKAVTRTEHEQEQNDNPEPTALTIETIVIVGSGTDVSQRIITIHK